MKKINILILSLGLASLGGGMSSALSQNDNEARPASRQPDDAVPMLRRYAKRPSLLGPSRKRTNTTVPTYLLHRTQSPLHLLLIISPTRERYWGLIFIVTL